MNVREFEYWPELMIVVLMTVVLCLSMFNNLWSDGEETMPRPFMSAALEQRK